MSYLQADFYTIECLSNTLVGSGKANYGVIDQLVQRDAATHLPVIHASGLKGAIKEYCSYHNSTGTIDIKKIFGSVKDNNTDTATGAYKFLDAHLLSIPVRSDKRAFVQITCPLVLENLSSHLGTFGKRNLVEKINSFASLIKNNDTAEAYCFSEGLNKAILEDFEFSAVLHQEIKSMPLVSLFGDDIVLVSNYIFQTLTNDLHLPVIARNHLENGESENLWYEQVIPRKSRFWFVLLKPPMQGPDEFTGLLVQDDTVIQIGANATVGYGYTKINALNG